MNRPIKPVNNGKQAQINWVNSIVHIHDLQCACDDPLEHTISTIFKQEKNLRFNEQEKAFMQKCLTTTEETTGDKDEDGFGDGDLERIFAQDIGEEEETTATG